MTVKLDSTIMSSRHESYKNYNVQTATIVVSGSIPVGGQAFTTTKTLDRDGTRADIYYTTLSEKRPMNASVREPKYGGGSTANTVIKYSGSTVETGIFVNNFGGAPIAVTSQTYLIEVVEYDAPIADL